MHVKHWTLVEVTNGTKCQDILQILKIICAQLPIKDISSFLLVMSNWFCRVCNKACFCLFQIGRNVQLLICGPGTDEEFWWWSAKRWCDPRVDLWHQLTGKNFCAKMIWSIVITLGGNLLDISKNSGGDLHKDDMYDPHVYLSSWQVRFLRKEDKFQCIAINLGGNLLALSNFCTIPASLSTFTLKRLRMVKGASKVMVLIQSLG